MMMKLKKISTIAAMTIGMLTLTSCGEPEPKTNQKKPASADVNDHNNFDGGMPVANMTIEMNSSAALKVGSAANLSFSVSGATDPSQVRVYMQSGPTGSFLNTANSTSPIFQWQNPVAGNATVIIFARDMAKCLATGAADCEVPQGSEASVQMNPDYDVTNTFQLSVQESSNIAVNNGANNSGINNGSGGNPLGAAGTAGIIGQLGNLGGGIVPPELLKTVQGLLGGGGGLSGLNSQALIALLQNFGT